MSYCRWLISYRVENVVYSAEDKHIHHFGGSFNAKLGYICHIRRRKTHGPVKKLLKGEHSDEWSFFASVPVSPFLCSHSC